MTIDGKVVAITGASSGIGEATAELLAQRGAKPVLGARRADKLNVIEQPPDVDVGEIVVRPTAQA